MVIPIIPVQLFKLFVIFHTEPVQPAFVPTRRIILHDVRDCWWTHKHTEFLRWCRILREENVIQVL